MSAPTDLEMQLRELLNARADALRPSIDTGDDILAIEAIVSVGSFAVILWNLSGDLSLFGATLPRAMFWIGIVYVVVATVIAFWIGRPLIGLSFRNELCAV